MVPRHASLTTKSLPPRPLAPQTAEAAAGAESPETLLIELRAIMVNTEDLKIILTGVMLLFHGEMVGFDVCNVCFFLLCHACRTLQKMIDRRVEVFKFSRASRKLEKIFGEGKIQNPKNTLFWHASINKINQ